MKFKLIPITIVVALVAGNIFLAIQYFTVAKELEATKIVNTTQRYNEKVILFIKLFVAKVIKSDKEIDFETRLKLENAVRDLNEPLVLAQWQNFVNSKTEAEAQQNVKDLLAILMDRVYIR